MTKLSTQTFIEQVNNGNVRTAKVRIYRLLKRFGATKLEYLRVDAGYSHQTLTARLSDLMDIGVVWQNEKDEFYVTEEKDWQYYANLRREQRYQRWLKVGEKEGFVIQTTV